MAGVLPLNYNKTTDVVHRGLFCTIIEHNLIKLLEAKEMERLAKKTVIVTGAASGIGKAIVLYLLEKQYQVFCFDRNEEGLKLFFNEEALKENAAFYVGDVSKKEDVSNALAVCVKRFGDIYGLVSSAGIVKKDEFLSMEENSWDTTMDINLKGTFLWGQMVGRWLVENQISGSIVHIGCMRASLVCKGMSAYAASKGGIRNFTKAMAVELAPYNIRVNAIEPGRTLTETLQNYMTDHKAVEKRLQLIPLGRFAKPEDIAKAAYFLLSEDANYITGAILPVDGGYSIYKE